MNIEPQDKSDDRGKLGDSDKIDRIIDMVLFLKNKTSNIEVRQHKRVNKLKDALNSLGSRTSSNEEKAIENEEKIAALQARLMACEAERDMTAEQLERITARLDIVESRADRTDKEILDIVTEVKERKIVLTGVPEFRNEKIMVTVVSTINKLISAANASLKKEASNSHQIAKVDQKDFEITYRIGKLRSNYKRNILVSCSTIPIKNRIMDAKSKARLSKGIKFFVNNDMTPSARLHMLA